MHKRSFKEIKKSLFFRVSISKSRGLNNGVRVGDHSCLLTSYNKLLRFFPSQMRGEQEKKWGKK